MLQVGMMLVTSMVQPVCNQNLAVSQKSHPQGGFFAF